jgi:2-hydroxychromene-2-carboxylate isomerase
MNQPALPCAWYFDVLSPFAYLQWKTRARFGDRIRLQPVPVVFGAILDRWGQKGPAEIGPKRLHTYRACQWKGEKLGIPFRFPPAHPFNPLPALRLIVALDATEAAVDAVFDAVFKDGLDTTDPVVLDALGRSFGIADAPDRIASPEVKQRLRDNTDAAVARGVFGVPTIAVGDELFWGEDVSEMALDYVQDRALFDTTEMRRLRALPVGIVRRQKLAPA